ncbi:MAG: Rrf2 family transcriptional regulator [Planctomycetes bacterium]|nr:Rrf2 family transcriptional regulator [Planctomycetota bacterium]
MLSETSEHVLRALRWIAASPRPGALVAEAISRGAEVPRGYLSKILARLVQAGVLTARRGVSGGYVLARPASQISLVDIVTPFEPVLGHSGCVFGGGRVCNDANQCPVHREWGSIRDALLKFLGRTTLADLAAGVKKKTRRTRAKCRSRNRRRKSG